MNAIEAKDLAKKYDIYSKPSHRVMEFLSLGKKKLHTEHWALKGINLSLEKGGTLGIIGANGSGKSTLLKLISGITLPTQGSIETRGRVAAIIELGAGFHPEFSGRSNVYMNASLMGITHKEIDERFDQIVEFAGLRQFIDYPIKTYSSGMQVRLAFSVAINVSPDILLIDEALAVGDALFQHKCLKKIREFQEQGITVIFVTHDFASLKALCNQSVLLEKGTILEKGDTVSVVDRYQELIAEKEGKSIKSIGVDLVYPEEDGDAKNRTSGRRYGSFEAKIARVRVLNEDGQERAAFVSGDEIILQVDVHILEAIENLTVGILIRNRQGLELYGTNTFHQKTNLGPCAAGAKITVSFSQRMALASDDYFVIAALHSMDTHHSICYDWWNEITRFKILPGNVPFSGMVDLNSSVEVTKESSDAREKPPK